MAKKINEYHIGDNKPDFDYKGVKDSFKRRKGEHKENVEVQTKEQPEVKIEPKSTTDEVFMTITKGELEIGLTLNVEDCLSVIKTVLGV